MGYLSLSDQQEYEQVQQVRAALGTWRLLPFPEKHPSLDGMIFCVDPVATKRGYRVEPFHFNVQFKSRGKEHRNVDGSMSKELEVEDIQEWVDESLPVMVIVYAADSGRLLYEWVNDGWLEGLSKGQTTKTIRFQKTFSPPHAPSIEEVRRAFEYQSAEVPVSGVVGRRRLRQPTVTAKHQNVTLYSDMPPRLNTFSEDRRLERDALVVRAEGDEQVGINRRVPFLNGRAHVEFQASSSCEGKNLALFAIPVRTPAPGEQGNQGPRLFALADGDYVEPGDGSLRVRCSVAPDQLGNGSWKTAEFDFDFTGVPGTQFTVIAARINEGTAERGPGELAICRVQVT